MNFSVSELFERTGLFGVLKGHAHEIAVCVNIYVHVLRDFPSLDTRRFLEFYKGSISVGKVSDVPRVCVRNDWPITSTLSVSVSGFHRNEYADPFA